MSEDRPKLTRGLVQNLGHVEDRQQQVPIIVRYSSTMRVMRHAEPMRGVRRSYDYHLRPFAAMQATPEAIQQLESDPEVVKIYEDRPVYAILDTALPVVQVPRLWQEGAGGAGVRIAIVDTGIDPEHPDFQGRIGATTDVTGEGPVDGNGHGTHCAGIAAGSGIASGGKYRGVAPAATLYSAKVLRSDGQGMTSDVMAGVEWAVDQGVQIISLSLGSAGSSDGTDALSEICDAAVEQGIMVCVAAGNEGPGPYTVGSPGAARQVLTVGASTDADQIASFSSRGPTADGRLKPDIVCPGVNIIAPRAQGTAMGTVVNDSYTAASGTSMATPLAAGVCALLLEAEPQLTPLEIKARLIGTAVDLGVDAYAQGKGRVDAWQARHTEVEPGPTPPAPPPPSPSPGQGCLTALFSLLFWKPSH